MGKRSPEEIALREEMKKMTLHKIVPKEEYYLINTEAMGYSGFISDTNNGIIHFMKDVHQREPIFLKENTIDMLHKIKKGFDDRKDEAFEGLSIMEYADEIIKMYYEHFKYKDEKDKETTNENNK